MAATEFECENADAWIVRHKQDAALVHDSGEAIQERIR
jgi:hypothetical protein